MTARPDEKTNPATDRLGRRLRVMLRPWRGRIVLAVLCILGQVACILAGPALVREGIDIGIKGHDSGALDRSAALFVVAAIAALIFGRLAIQTVAQVGETFLRDLRVRVFRHLLDLGLDFFEREQTGRLVSRMTSDVDALQELIQQGLASMAQSALLIVGAFVVIFTLSWQLALCTLLVVPPVLVASRWFRRESKRAYLDVRERIGHNLATLQEGLAGVRVVQAFGRERAFAGRFRETNDAQFDANMETVRISTRYFPFMEFLGVAATGAIIGIGGIFVDNGIVTVGTVVAFILYLSNLFEPVQVLSQQYNTVQSAGAALRKLFDLLDVTPSIAERANAVDLPGIGALEVSSVSFAYAAYDVLRDVSLTIAPGERVALVGPTGAGKSTLAKLIVRFYDPREGSVSFGGIDLRDATLASLRERIVVVPQEGYLFTGTVRENVRFGRPSATDADVEAAIESLGIRERFDALPEGLDTEVLERGSRLSGGERQLVSLARRARRSRGARARRSHVEPRSRHRAHRRARARGADRGAHGRGGGPPALDRRPCGSGRGDRRRHARRGRHPRRARRPGRPLRGPLRLVVVGRGDRHSAGVTVGVSGARAASRW